MSSKAEIKTTFHHLIDGIEDTTMLRKAYAVVARLLSNEKVDFWDELSYEEKEAIEEGIAQADRGELISHDEVMAEIKTKFNL